MKPGISIFFAVILSITGLTPLQAQSLYIRENSGTQAEYSLDAIRKLTFPPGSVVVHETAGTSDSYAVSGLRYMNFEDLSAPDPPDPPGPASSVPAISSTKLMLMILLFILSGAVFLVLKKKKQAGRLISILMLIILSTALARAQNDKMYVMGQGRAIGAYDVVNTDSLVFYNTSGLTDSLYILEGSLVIAKYKTNSIDSVVFYKPANYISNTVTDADGNVYPVVRIGNQFWMAENLKTTKYNDGSPIPLVTDNTAWTGLSMPAYCWYYNDQTTYGHIYGALYNWFTINTGNLCPTGWHVPDDDEWTTLTTFLGGETVAGGKLKENGTNHWVSPNTGATNETGFTALPGGLRSGGYGNFSDIDYGGNWWSATISSTSGTWYRNMSHSIGTVSRGGGIERLGFSVRCLLDNQYNEEAFPGLIGEEKHFVVNQDTIFYELINGLNIYQGDIILTDEQVTPTKGTGITSLSERWPEGIVYYTLNDNLPSETRICITKAIQHYENNTSLRFVTDKNQTNYAEFIDSNDGTYAYLGMKSGKQTIAIEHKKWDLTGTIIHEIGHTIGLEHEHSRIDRGQFIVINWLNIKPGKWSQYRINKQTFHSGDFDFNSIMIYGSYSGNAILNSKPVMVKKEPKDETYLANRQNLSALDIEMIHTLYNKPIVVTAPASNISSNSAIVGGEATNNNSTQTLECGIYYGKEINPEKTGTKIQIGSGEGKFDSTISGLTENTTYYVKAYATNNAGTTYGNQVNFTTTVSGTEVVYVYNPATGKTWMDRNLGASRAATSSTDAEAYGDLYQWGRGTDGHEKRTSGTTSTLSTSDTPGHANFILATSSPYLDWRSPQNTNLWQGVSGVNNPCPSGYRLPTLAEWEAERQSWGSNNAAGAFASPLKLPVAGYRDDRTGSLNSVGSYGYYWSSTVDGITSRYLVFNINAYVYANFRAYGFSVRCLKD